MMPNICKDVQYFSGRSGPIILGNPWAVSYEVRHMFTINSIIPFLGLYPKELKHMSTQHLLQNIGNSFFFIARKEKQTKYSSTAAWIHNLWIIPIPIKRNKL